MDATTTPAAAVAYFARRPGLTGPARKRTTTLVATAPDGHEIKIRTAAGYTVAGLACIDGTWTLVAKGWSRESVRRRAATRAHLPAAHVRVTAVKERPQLDGDPVIAHVHKRGSGWTTWPIRKRITVELARTLRAAGVTAVALAYAGRVADFPIEELTRT